MHDTLTTLAEESGFRQTGRSDEVTRLCAAFAAAWPDAVRELEFGRSAEGRPCARCSSARADARAGCRCSCCRRASIPGRATARTQASSRCGEMLEGRAAPGALERIAILFVPAFNVDGHERFGRWNRPNQNGPEETGWRTTAQNLNLNRDYTKADSPEMRAHARADPRAGTRWCAPTCTSPTARTSSPTFRCRRSRVNQGDPQLFASRARTARRADREARARRARCRCPSTRTWPRADDPASGLSAHGLLAALLHRLFPAAQPLHGSGRDALVEGLRARACASPATPSSRSPSSSRSTARSGSERRGRRTRTPPGSAAREVVLDYSSGWREGTGAGGRSDAGGAGGDAAASTFPATRTRRAISAISGEPVDACTIPTRRRSGACRTAIRCRRRCTVQAPLGGYVVPAAWAQEIGARLALHGIAVRAGAHGAAARCAREVFRASAGELQPRAVRGAHARRSSRQLAARGAGHGRRRLFVPIAQPRGAPGDASARAAGAGFVRRLGVLQRLLRAEGSTGALRGRADRARECWRRIPRCSSSSSAAYGRTRRLRASIQRAPANSSCAATPPGTPASTSIRCCASRGSPRAVC